MDNFLEAILNITISTDSQFPDVAYSPINQAVTADGKPIRVYRGQHGDSNDWTESLIGSLSFGSAESASAYALQPNVQSMKALFPKVFPVFLTIKNPFINRSDDPFMDLSYYCELFGMAETIRIALKFKDYVEHTNAWMELSEESGFDCIEDLIASQPTKLLQLYFELYALLDDPEEVCRLRAAGYDGAIYGGSGITALEAEYRVFSANQVYSVWDKNLHH